MDSENLITLIKNNIKVSNSKAIRYSELEINYQDENGDTPLHWVIRKNQCENFNNLLKNNYLDINIINKKGQSLLMEAINNDNYKFINPILNHKKFKAINYKDINNNSCFHYALNLESEKIALRLLEVKNLDINLTNYKGHSLLASAAYNKKYLVVHEIIKKYKPAILSNIILNITNTMFFLFFNKKWQLLLALIEILPNNSLVCAEDVFIFKKIINEEKWNVAEQLLEKIDSSLFNFKNSDECHCILNWLILKMEWKILKIFMNKIELEILDSNDQYSIFLKFIENNKWDLMEILVKKVDLKLLVEFQNIFVLEHIIFNDKWTICDQFLKKILPNSLGINDLENSARLLHILLSCGKWNLALQMIEKLTSNCFIVKDSFYNLPILFLAVEYKNEEVGIKILNKLTEKLLLFNFNNDCQPLHLAIEFKLFKLSKNIIDRLPISLLDNSDSKSGLTALHLAIINESKEIALQLIDKLPPEKLYPIDVKFNATPLHFAIAKKSTDIIIALIEKLPLEAFDVGDCQGYIPFQVAIKNQQLEIAKRLLDKMPLKSLIYKNDKCIESPLITTQDDNAEEIFVDLMAKIVVKYEEVKNSNSTYLRILKENWKYFKEISDQLQWNIKELSNFNDEDGEEEIQILFQFPQNEKNIASGKDLFINSSNLTKKSKSGALSYKLNVSSRNLNLRKINHSNVNPNNKIREKSGQVKNQKNQIKSKNEKVINKSQSKCGQLNYEQIEKSLLYLRLNENKAELYEKECQEKKKQKNLKTGENSKNSDDFLLEANNPSSSNIEEVEVLNKEINELNQLRLKIAESIRSEIIKIRRKSGVDGNGRPAIFIGKIKNTEDKILILFGTKKEKENKAENINKIESLQINNDNLQQYTNFYCNNFRIISRNELCGLWNTNKKLFLEKKEIIASFLSRENLEKLNSN